MDTARITEHIHDYSEEKTRNQECRFVTVYRIQNDKQDVRVRIDIAEEIDVIENNYLGRKQQYKTGDIE